MKVTKQKVNDLLKKDSMTVYEICNALKIDDDLEVVAIITELEIEEKIELINFKTCYEPDGSAFYLGKYKSIKT